MKQWEFLMPTVKYIVKIKDRPNLPEFKEGLGVGVLEVGYANIKSEEPIEVAMALENLEKTLKESWFEIIIEENK